MSILKKNLKVGVLFCLFFFLFLTVNINAQTLLGDVNDDGTVNIIDALLVARYSVGNAVSINISQSDVNCDGVVNIIDALRLAQYNVGLLPAFICTSPTSNPILNYVQGEIIVGFYDYVTLEEADNLVLSYDLSWKPSFPVSFEIWLEVQDDPEYYIALLTESSIVGWAKVRGYSGGDPDKTYIIAHINGTRDEAETLINGIDGVKIVGYVTASKWGLVKVPVGYEIKWINTFTSQSIVKSASLNYIVTIN